MPRETVFGSELPYGPDDPAVAIVEVSWSRDGFVQLVSKCVNRVDHSPLSFTSNASASIAIEPIPDFRDGFYVNLDRAGINALIRHLRRARDHAFGRDE